MTATSEKSEMQIRFDANTLGLILIILGVAAWAPFFYLLSVGREVSIFPFLALHLTGVLSGARLRSRGAKPMEQTNRSWRVLSSVLIYLGVLAWAPYFYLTRVAELDMAITPFLAAHLTGVLSGIGLRVYLQFR